MHQLRAKLGALALGGSVAALVLAGTPALASTHHAARSVTGPEAVTGAVYGRAAVANVTHIPLRLRGVVNTSDRSFVLGSGKAKKHGLKTPAGTLVVKGAGKKQSTARANQRTCRESFTEDQTFHVLGARSTGKFAGASGPGAVQIFFAAFAPRKHGKCDFKSNRVRAKGAVARFLATIVLTVRK